MNNDIRTQVIDLLENYPVNERKIAVLHFELDNYSCVPNNEMIEAMALTHGDGAGAPAATSLIRLSTSHSTIRPRLTN